MADLPQLNQGAEPRFYRGGDVGCLVVHGFMASPAEVAWAGDYLAQQGYTVYVPRLTGHGINPRHMRRMRWQDWYAQVLDSYHILRQQCQRVVVIGHSMGGLLALLLASEHPLDALVVSASPFMLGARNTSVRYARWLDYLMPYTIHESEPELNAQIVAEQRQRGEPITSRVHYRRWSSRAVHQFYLLEQSVQAHITRVSAPLLLLYAEQDSTGTPEDAQQIARAVRSTHIETYLLDAGGHIIFQDRGRGEAFAALVDFIARILAMEEVS
ncbi:MAG: alpha/beta hydrolase [Anaerolineae bacterium]